MPIYVYRCTSCGLAQEHLHGANDPAPSCGADTLIEKAEGDPCGEPKLERQVTSASVRFERSIGWDGWDRIGPGTVGRVVKPGKHIDDQTEAKNPGSRKAV